MANRRKKAAGLGSAPLRMGGHGKEKPSALLGKRTKTTYTEVCLEADEIPRRDKRRKRTEGLSGQTAEENPHGDG